MNQFHQIIKEICDEKKINFSILSKDWVIMLRKDGKTKYICGYKFDLNEHALGLALDDKYATYDIMKTIELPIIEHNIVYGPNNNSPFAEGCNNFEYLKDLFIKYNEDVVLKINDGTCGRNVNHIKNLDDLSKSYHDLATKSYSLSLCPFYDIENEFRVIILNQEIKLIYKKIRPIVTGDGKSTIKELLQAFNPQYFVDYNEENQNQILEKGQVFEYDWKFNLSRGSKATNEMTVLEETKVSKIAKKTAGSINLGFGSVDIIKTKTEEYYVLEINSGVMMDNYITQMPEGYNKAKEIYQEAINSMFE